MNAATVSGFHHRVLQPAGHEGLTCRFLCPDDFKALEIPAEEADFANPVRFMPLGLMMAEYGMALFSVGARPAYDDGAVSQWLDFLCREQKFDRGEMETIEIGGMPAVACDAIQLADGMPVRMRLVLFEDGGRLFNLAATAPEKLWRVAGDSFAQMFASFELREKRGSKVPLTPDAVPQEPTKPEVPQQEAPAEAPASSLPTAKMNAQEFAETVLADDASSLDPENPMNVRLRDNGAGLTPRVISVNAEERSAIVGAGSISALIRVPFGWHVIDDGKRTLIFDAGGKMQINLSLRRSNGQSLAELAQQLAGQYLETQPDVVTATMEMDGVYGIGLRGLDIDGEKLNQLFLLRPSAHEGLVLVGRVTANDEDTTRAGNLGGDIVVRAEWPAN